ncbi:cupin domain-containing protein [uncultured Cohaesibacter sp.]|uniref:cupin domain-containing protein n=1 Tax=uncultured Cohaesibacter sp. TaxID=1002546 RepID=UPI002930724D|nr:cupin domain-containing protein [uncultured Cohaesibacter sp.]
MIGEVSCDYNGVGGLVIKDSFPDDWEGTPWHLHPYQSALIEVKLGIVCIETKAGVEIVGAGESYVIPAGIAHRIHNEALDGGQIELTLTPSYDGEMFLQGLANCARHGKSSLLQIALMNRLSDHPGFYYARIPIWLQNGLFMLLAPVARLLGYKARY